MSARTLATTSHTGLKAKRVCIRSSADMRIRITRLSPSFSGRRHSVVVLTIPLTATSRPRALHRVEPLYDDLGKTESIHASANTEYIVSDGRKDGAAAPQKTSYPGRNRASVRVAGQQEVIDVHGWMEFWACEHVKELAREARRQHFVRTLRDRQRDKGSSRSRRLLRWLAHGAAGAARKPAVGDGPTE